MPRVNVDRPVPRFSQGSMSLHTLLWLIVCALFVSLYACLQIVVEKEEAEAQFMATTTRAIADDAERDLAEALPALDLAVACLSKLKKVRIFAANNDPVPVTATVDVLDVVAAAAAVAAVAAVALMDIFLCHSSCRD